VVDTSREGEYWAMWQHVEKKYLGKVAEEIFGTISEKKSV
jgi:hypothetical protein